MAHYGFRLLARIASSELMPVSFRTRFMIAMGYTIAKDAQIMTGADLRSRKVSIEPGVFINVGVYHDGCEWLRIGANVCLGAHVRVITGTHVIGTSARRCSSDVSQPVRIEEGCWIGTGVIVMPGVIIRSGCIIGAGAVVAKSTAKDGVYAGVPARRIRDLDAA